MSESAVTRSELKAEVETLETRLLERIEKVETTLLKEFRKWASASSPASRLTRCWLPASTNVSSRLKSGSATSNIS